MALSTSALSPYSAPSIKSVSLSESSKKAVALSKWFSFATAKAVLPLLFFIFLSGLPVNIDLTLSRPAAICNGVLPSLFWIFILGEYFAYI